MGVRFLREISPKRGLVRKGSRQWLEVDIVRTIASIMQLGCTRIYALVPLVMPVVWVLKLSGTVVMGWRGLVAMRYRRIKRFTRSTPLLR